MPFSGSCLMVRLVVSQGLARTLILCVDFFVPLLIDRGLYKGEVIALLGGGAKIQRGYYYTSYR